MVTYLEVSWSPLQSLVDDKSNSVLKNVNPLELAYSK